MGLGRQPHYSTFIDSLLLTNERERRTSGSFHPKINEIKAATTIVQRRLSQTASSQNLVFGRRRLMTKNHREANRVNSARETPEKVQKCRSSCGLQW